MSDCIDILRSISATCASINQIGGVDKRAWVTQLNQIESYTFDSNGYLNSLVTKEIGTTNYRYELAQIVGKKNTHSGNYEGVVGENVSLVKQNAILKIYTDSPSDRDKVVELFDAQELVVFFENSNGKIEVFGLDKGLEGSALVGGTGTEMQDDTSVTITLTGDQEKLPYFFLYGGSLATSIEYLDNIGLSPIYSFSAKFPAVSSLDLTDCFLDSNGNDCATLINWGDGTIDSNLTHTYSASGDYVVSVVCEDAFEITISKNSINEFYYAIADNLVYLDLSTNQLTAFNPNKQLPNGLQSLNIAENLITVFNPSIALPIGLQYLGLGSNQIVDFNPSIALPIGLQSLELGFNQMTIAGYTASETWANAQPSFTSSCNVYFTNNIDSVSGTDLETILISKNCTIIV